jgi:hypothetical protein
MPTIQASRIQQLNDAFRTTFSGGQVMLSAGINALHDEDKVAILVAVKTFDAFTPDNDPHGGARLRHDSPRGAQSLLED